MKPVKSRVILQSTLFFVALGVGLRLAFADVMVQQTVLRSVTEATGYAGSGVDGAVTLNGTTGPNNTYKTDSTKTYLSSASAYSAGATALTVASSTGFAAGNVVLIIQMLGTNAGQYEFKSVSSVAAGTITLSAGLTNSYPGYSAGSNVVQVLKVPQYSSLTLNSGAYVTAAPWNGTTGGVVAFYASGNVTINYNATYSGRIVASGLGYAGGGASAAGSGPGAGSANVGGQNTSPGDRTRLIMGSGGGGGSSGSGGTGGGILIMKVGGTLTVNGAIYANGNAASGSNGGGGAGGTVSIVADQITGASCGPMTATGGAQTGTGTAGGAGRIFQAFKTSNACTNASPSASYLKFILK